MYVRSPYRSYLGVFFKHDFILPRHIHSPPFNVELKYFSFTLFTLPRYFTPIIIIELIFQVQLQGRKLNG